MFPYWLLFTFFAAGALQGTQSSSVRREARPVLIAGAALTALMIGLRFHVGGDWANYQGIFEDLRYTTLGEALVGSDPGYSVLNWLAHRLDVGIWFVNSACALIFAWGLTRFAQAQPFPWLTFLLATPYLVIVVAMGYTRQAAAISFIMLALNAYSREKMISFALLLIAATAFHKSAIVMLPIVGISATERRGIALMFTAVLGAVLYWLFVSAEIDHMTQSYTAGELASEGAAVRVAMSIIPACLFLGFQRRFGFSERDRKAWRNVSLTAVVTLAALLIAPGLSTLIDRLALYLIPLQLVVLSRLPVAFPHHLSRGNEFILLMIIYSAAIQYVWLNYAGHADFWLPYRIYPFGGDDTLLQ